MDKNILGLVSSIAEGTKEAAMDSILKANEKGEWCQQKYIAKFSIQLNEK